MLIGSTLYDLERFRINRENTVKRMYPSDARKYLSIFTTIACFWFAFQFCVSQRYAPFGVKHWAADKLQIRPLGLHFRLD